MDDPVRSQTRWVEFIHLPGTLGTLSLPPALPASPHNWRPRWFHTTQTDDEVGERPRTTRQASIPDLTTVVRNWAHLTVQRAGGVAGERRRACLALESCFCGLLALCLEVDYVPCSRLCFLIRKMGITMCKFKIYTWSLGTHPLAPGLTPRRFPKISVSFP